MKSHLFLFFVIASLSLCSSVPVHAQENQPIIAQPTIKELELPTHSSIHGFGISHYSEYDPEQSFRDAYEEAIYDLASTIMTSVYLEFYSTENIPTQLRSEFAMSDSVIIDNVISVDSAVVGDWAVYFVNYEGTDELIPSSLQSAVAGSDYTTEIFNPKKIGEYYIAAGRAKFSKFAPHRSFSLAKQDALTNLSLYIQTVVRDLSRVYGGEIDDFSKVNYTTSQNVFNKIYTLARKQKGEEAFVLLAVKENEILTWSNHDQ